MSVLRSGGGRMLEGAARQRISASAFRLKDLRVDVAVGVVSGPSATVHLEPRVMSVLEVLAYNAGALVSRTDLLRQIWPGGETYDEALTQCVYQLRQTLASAGGSHAYRDLVATVPKRGYLLKCEVTAIDPEPVQASLGQDSQLVSAMVNPAKGLALRWSTSLIGILLLMTLVAGVMTLFIISSEHPSAVAARAAAQTPATIAVLPFTNLGHGADSELLADGLAEELLGALALNPQLRVTARPSAFKFKGTDRDIPAVGRRLGVRYVLDGSVRSLEGRVQIQTRLVDTATGTQPWGEIYDRTLADWFDLQYVVATEVARAMSVALKQGDQTIAHTGGTASVDAHLELLRARQLLATRSVPDTDQSIEHLQRALTLDPNYATAYARLADAIMIQAESTTGIKAARSVVAPLLDKALALDPGLGEAYALRSLLTDDATAAERDLRHGLDLNPSYARGYELLAALQSTSPEGFDLAANSIDSAIALDPLTPGNFYTKASLKFAQGDWAGAAALDHHALELNPEFRAALVHLGWIASFEGRLAEAIGYMEQAVTLDPQAIPLRETLVIHYIAVGDLDGARAANTPPTPAGQAAILWAQGDTGQMVDFIYSGTLGPAGPMILSDQVSQIVLRQALSDRNFARALALFSNAYSGGEPLAPSVSAWQLYALANLVQLLAATDDAAAAARLEEKIEARMSEMEAVYSLHARVHDHVRAILLARAGQSDEACAALERVATPTPGPRWGFFISNPAFDGMRTAPCFEASLTRADTYFAGERAHVEEMRNAGQIPARARPAPVRDVAASP